MKNVTFKRISIQIKGLAGTKEEINISFNNIKIYEIIIVYPIVV